MTKFILALLLFVVIVIAINLFQGNRYKEFMKTADKTSGTLVRKEERLAEPKTKRKEYWAHYTYTDKAGNKYNKQELVEYPDIWTNLREHYSVDVYYNPKKPSESYLALLISRRLGMVTK